MKNKKRNFGNCRLCNQERKFIDAHIIPSFMYKQMKETEKAFYKVTYNLKTLESKPNKIQTGEFDKNILCESCDNEILGSIYEKYAQASMYGTNLDPKIAPVCKNHIDKQKNIEFSVCQNLDYTKLKLFFLSLLWRASITNRPIFKDVNIGNEYEEKIRIMLLNNITPEEYEFPILITSFFRTSNSFKNLITQPKLIESREGLNGYVFLINGLQITFYLNTLPNIPSYIQSLTLNKNGEMTIIHLPDGSELDFIKNMLNPNGEYFL